jgi:hypothetical protein
VAAEWLAAAKDSPDENARLDLQQVRSLYVDAGNRPRDRVRIDLDDLQLMDVRVLREEAAP